MASLRDRNFLTLPAVAHYMAERSPSSPRNVGASPTGRPRAPDYGKGTHEIDGERLLEASSEEVVRRVLVRFRQPDYVPPVLPTVALDLLAMTRQVDVDISGIAKAIEKDSMLAARVLRLAQSPLYAVRTPVRSIADALLKLGLDRLTQLVMETALSAKVFRAPGYEAPMARLARHSKATAHIARVVGAAAGANGEYAFLCGLLHDVGIAAVMISPTALPRGESPPSFESVWPIMLATHEEISGILARLWGFSAELQHVMGHHHSYQMGGQTNALAAVVFISGALATELGAGCDEAFHPDAIARSGASLGLSKETLEKLRAQAATIVECVS